jgi:uncharacterized protein (TIGR02996 family)
MSSELIEAGLMRAWADDPASDTHWRVLADWLEDHSDPRAELLRLHREILAAPWGQAGAEKEQRLLELLDADIRPVLPRLTNSLGMEFVLITPGSFLRGADWAETRPESRAYEDERPRHPVTLTRPFWLGVYQVTQEDYRAVTRRNPSAFPRTGRYPVENLTWERAEAYCLKLSGRASEKKAGRAYRLPMEAEWEYACRAGSHRKFHFRTRLTHEHACFEHPLVGDAPEHPTAPAPVGTYSPNAFGLFDMHGNVWEWCSDWYDPDLYERRELIDPPGPESSPEGLKVFRGGAWCSRPMICRAACRSADQPSFHDNYLGLRVALQWRPGMM